MCNRMESPEVSSLCCRVFNRLKCLVSITNSFKVFSKLKKLVQQMLEWLRSFGYVLEYPGTLLLQCDRISQVLLISLIITCVFQNSIASLRISNSFSRIALMSKFPKVFNNRFDVLLSESVISFRILKQL